MNTELETLQAELSKWQTKNLANFSRDDSREYAKETRRIKARIAELKNQ